MANHAPRPGSRSDSAPREPSFQPRTGRARPEDSDLDSAIDQSEGIGASGVDVEEAHEGGLETDRALGNDQRIGRRRPTGDTIVDETVNPDTSFRAGYSLDDAGNGGDLPVFDRGNDIPGRPAEEREPPATQVKRTR